MLSYTTLHERPIIAVAVQGNDHRIIYPMIVDTGADTTCFPASLAALVGHDNQGIGVEEHLCIGIGGEATAYLHTVKVSLLDPYSPPDTIWDSSLPRFRFVDAWDSRFGLIGRDMMQEWKSTSFTFQPARKRWLIQIDI